MWPAGGCLINATATTTPSRHRLKLSSRRSAAQATSCNLPAKLSHRAPSDFPFSHPWEYSSNWSVQADNLAPQGSHGDTTPYLSFIRHLNTRFIIYTEVSATAGTLSGGAGMLVTEGDPHSRLAPISLTRHALVAERSRKP